MYTYKVMIHPNNKQATKIRCTLNKCIECQNIVCDYLDSFLTNEGKIPSCSDVRKWFTIQKKNKDNEVIQARMNMTKKEMIKNHLNTLFYDVSKQLFNWTDTYVIDVKNPNDALYVLMLVLAIDAEKCSKRK